MYRLAYAFPLHEVCEPFQVTPVLYIYLYCLSLVIAMLQMKLPYCGQKV